MPTTLHLFAGDLADQHESDLALCGRRADKRNLLPARHWNGRRDGVCPECVRIEEARKTGLTPPPSAVS